MQMKVRNPWSSGDTILNRILPYPPRPIIRQPFSLRIAAFALESSVIHRLHWKMIFVD
jgi:hypothetical protein